MMVGSFDRLRPFSTAESSSPASSPKRTRPSPTRKPPTSSTTSRNLVGLIPTVSAADRQQEEKKKEQLGMAAYSISLNYIKQLGLKDNLHLKLGLSMETLCPHEYDIPLVKGGHLEGPHVFGFLIHVFPCEIWTQT